MPCHDSVDDGPRGTLSRTNSVPGATVIKIAGGRGESHGWDPPKSKFREAELTSPAKYK